MNGADVVAPLRAALLGGAGFTVPPQPARVLFGAGALDRLPELVEALHATRVLVLASARREVPSARIAALLGARFVGVETGAAMHVPAELAERVRADVARSGADLVIAVGGGSPIGMAKAVALDGGPPCLAIPTTYSGSEMTPVWGLTRDGAKRTGRDERVRPRAVLYDPELTLDLPPHVSGPSALNAVAHCVEALYAPDATPLTALVAAEGLRALASSVGRVVRAPGDLAARTEALYGAWLAGLSLGSAAMGLHHKLCHVLGGSFGLPHAETHAVVLPHAVAYNAGAASAAMTVAARALDAAGLSTPVSSEVPASLHALLRDVAAATGGATSLRELGLGARDLDRAAALVVGAPYANPRPVEAEGVRALLGRAHAGAPPVPGA